MTLRRAFVFTVVGVVCAAAAVVDIETHSRTLVAGGRSFGSSGTYERIVGRVRFAIDPSHALNKEIADINRAPRNPAGLVEFSADLYLLRPLDLSKGNGTVLFEVVNRGKKGMLSTFDRARSSNNPVSAEHMGDGLLLNEGYTLAWLGWQHDSPKGEGLMKLHAPAASGVRGLVRVDYAASPGTTTIPLGDAGHIPYPITDKDSVRVSVRREIYGPRTPLRSADWTLGSDGQIVLARPEESGGIYEVVYESSDPAIAGPGLAAMRDLVSYLRRDHRYAIGFGVSQSAMVLRAFVYEGFNQDENGNRVFDGIFSHVAGGRRSTFQRFTQPSRTAGPLRNASLSPTEQFPFSDIRQRDPITGVSDGLLEKAVRARVVPKIFHTNSTYEYWGSGASLLHTTPDGSADVKLPATSRMYVFAGGQHSPARLPPGIGNGQNLPNFNDYQWVMRALLGRLLAWVSRNVAPPESVYPTIAGKTLVPLSQYTFPPIPGVSVPTIMHVPHSLDFGPGYRESGVITREPPEVRGAFVPLVAQADRDGEDLGGVRMPEIDCAIGAFTGWNLRASRVGLTAYLLGNTGSYFPFPRTAAEALRTGDPRRSVSDRFADEVQYSACVDSRSEALIRAGMLLPTDKEAIRDAAVRHWRWRMEEPAAISSARGR